MDYSVDVPKLAKATKAKAAEGPFVDIDAQEGNVTISFSPGFFQAVVAPTLSNPPVIWTHGEQVARFDAGSPPEVDKGGRLMKTKVSMAISSPKMVKSTI